MQEQTRFKYYIGIDEVGRGPLAGPVTVCALISFGGKFLEQFAKIKDSKKLTEQKRKEWFTKIKECKNQNLLDFKVFSMGNRAIDKLGIVRCITKSLNRCLDDLKYDSLQTSVMLDGGLVAPKRYVNQETIIGGDSKEQLIAMASVVAKVSRDWLMTKIADKYPNYGFEKHKGYGTKAHYEAISKFGICDLHRKSFLKKPNKYKIKNDVV